MHKHIATIPSPERRIELTGRNRNAAVDEFEFAAESTAH
jgi:hypothetical protein